MEGTDNSEKDVEDWLSVVCGALSTLVLIPTGVDHSQFIMEFFHHEAFQRKLYEMVSTKDEDDEEFDN